MSDRLSEIEHSLECIEKKLDLHHKAIERLAAELSLENWIFDSDILYDAGVRPKKVISKKLKKTS